MKLKLQMSVGYQNVQAETIDLEDWGISRDEWENKSDDEQWNEVMEMWGWNKLNVWWDEIE